MSLIPQIKLSEFKGMTPDEVGKLPSAEIVDEGGKYLATLIVPPEVGGMTIIDEIQINAGYLGVRGNSILPTEVREMTSFRKAKEIVDKYPNLTKARAVRMAKKAEKEAVKV